MEHNLEVRLGVNVVGDIPVEVQLEPLAGARLQRLAADCSDVDLAPELD